MCTANYERTVTFFLFLQLSVISWLPVISTQGKSNSPGLVDFVNRLVHVTIFDKNVKKNGH